MALLLLLPLMLLSARTAKNRSTPTQITHISWGKIEVLHTDGSSHRYEKQPGAVNSFCDCKVSTHNGSWAWDWNINEINTKKIPTRHRPGIQPADVETLITNADIIILSRGMDGILEVHPETITFLELHKKQIIIEKTPQAVQAFNKLSKEGKKVAGVFHSTC